MLPVWGRHTALRGAGRVQDARPSRDARRMDPVTNDLTPVAHCTRAIRFAVAVAQHQPPGVTTARNGPRIAHRGSSHLLSACLAEGRRPLFGHLRSRSVGPCSTDGTRRAACLIGSRRELLYPSRRWLVQGAGAAIFLWREGFPPLAVVRGDGVWGAASGRHAAERKPPARQGCMPSRRPVSSSVRRGYQRPRPPPRKRGERSCWRYEYPECPYEYLGWPYER